MKSYFNTAKGQDYLYRLCNEDDARAGVDTPMPKIKNKIAKMDKIPLWARFIKFRNFIMP